MRSGGRQKSVDVRLFGGLRESGFVAAVVMIFGVFTHKMLELLLCRHQERTCFKLSPRMASFTCKWRRKKAWYFTSPISVRSTVCKSSLLYVTLYGSWNQMLFFFYLFFFPPEFLLLCVVLAVRALALWTRLTLNSERCTCLCLQVLGLKPCTTQVATSALNG